MSFAKKIVHRVGRLLFKIPNALIRRTQWWRGLFVDYDHKRYPDNVWYREHDERNYDCVNLGSSSAYWCFDYAQTGIRGMNWANVPQTLLDDFRLLKNFHSILRQGGKVLIVIMPFTGLNKRTGVMDTFKYFGTLDGVLMNPEFRRQAARLHSCPIRFGLPAFKAVARMILGKERSVPLPIGSDLEINPMDAELLEADAKRWVDGWKRQFVIDDLEAPLTPANLEGRQVRVEAMRALIDFTRERGYEPVYVIPPVTKPLAMYFTPRFWERYIGSFLAEVGREVQTLDYLHMPQWQDPSLYFNSFFMNARGRRLFTQQVMTDLGLLRDTLG